MPYERKTVDINSSESFRNYLSRFKKTSEIADILHKERIDKDIVLENHIDYISISEGDPTKISYLTKERIELIKSRNECLWTSSKRFHCKPGAFVSKILKDISSKSIESFSNQYKSLATQQEFKFEIVDGAKIKDFYYQESYVSQKGSIGASCMKYEKCKKYFNIYSENPDVVKMLIMKNENDLILGRSLVWNFTWEGVDYKIMDRIYTTKDEELSIFFKNWASDNGYLYKKHQNWSNTLQFEGSESEVRVGIKLKNFTFDYYPYLDTFKWVDFEKGILYNYLPNYFKRENKYHRLSCGPEGYTEWADYLSFDEIDRNWGYKGDIINVDGIMTSIGNCVYSETFDKYILKKDSIWSAELRDYIYSDRLKIDINLIKKRLNLLNKPFSEWIVNMYGPQKNDIYEIELDGGAGS
jgi:hypothetical protein